MFISKKIIPILALVLLVLIGHFVFSTTKPEKSKEPSSFQRGKELGSKEQENKLDKVLKEEIGQMLIIGFRGTSFQDKSFIAKAISELKISGVVLFDIDVPSGIFPRNITSPEQTKGLIADLQKHSSTPLFIAVDAEGGKVNPLKPKYGFINVPSSQQMGQGAPEQTEEIAKNLGKQLKDLGFNFDFSPGVDLSNNEQSFSSDPLKVIAQAESFIKGLAGYNIITSLKHFPGLGSFESSSSQGVIDITSTYQAVELVPFQELVKNGLAPTVMVSHIINKNLDQNYPATLSANIIQKTLKDLVGFKGAVVCDDLPTRETAVKMVQAGCDLIIISNNVSSYDETLPSQVSDAISQAVKSGAIATSSIETSYNKIIKLKKDFGIIK